MSRPDDEFLAIERSFRSRTCWLSLDGIRVFCTASK